ncbi:CopG family transcriptional regulator [Clostridium botulinum]|uniref:ribbon-helix-helix domain-containing protein n=1 Tax=Clostridium TaxID=1485 RepID=UPI001A914DB6|nr:MULTISPECIES: CopG family transcriptional regulator [Clostridium]EKO1911695.1 CopG family transcriptional regulator [Clostridium botulinum]EKO2041756.1 CopG family transcriptional regulator [Clostridium botulinum]MBO0523863.1 CopG family transcriptional regulator [Clostridium botulinum]MBO0528298.1 CopG family transcriptional regulator [Clostridium botulinum]MBO0530882.1 CopG family transcriptional regulator [Clostridium botulinum]
MNKNFNKIPKNVLDQVDNLIGDSGMSKEEFIKNLIMTYGINSEANNYAEYLKGYDAYCDSFIG